MASHFNKQIYSIFTTLVWAVVILSSLLNSLPEVNADLQADSNDDLIFVQAVWRHGDRSPTATWKNDPNQEKAWPQGWGQLTTDGMAQHVVLGKRLRQKYIVDKKLLSDTYKNYEIYLSSTDVNRTLTSAISNMIGFYGESAKKGVDYPDKDWPAGFIPIAVHTVNNHNDHVGNADAYCPRKKKVYDLWKETPEYQQLMKEKKWVFDNLTKLCGQEMKVDNFWLVADALYIENLWKDRLNLKMPDWATPEFIEEIYNINWKIESWSVGKMQPYKGLDFSLEMPKMRGGGLLWTLIDHMQSKVDCLKQAQEENKRVKLSPKCEWMNKLKYFVFSVHDTTIASLFAALGFNKTNYDTEGYPHYSACVTVELWQKPDKSNYVKVLYWIPTTDDPTKKIDDMTSSITGCTTNCFLEKFIQRSLPFKAEPNPQEYCQNLDLNLSSSALLTNCLNLFLLIGFALLNNVIAVDCI